MERSNPSVSCYSSIAARHRNVLGAAVGYALTQPSAHNWHSARVLPVRLKELQQADPLIAAVLPRLNCQNIRRARVALNHLRLDHCFHALPFPVGRRLGEQGLEIDGVIENLPCRLGSFF